MSLRTQHQQSAVQLKTPFGALNTGNVAAGLRLLQVATIALTTLIFILIALGGLVRNEGAGLACPDWPLCHGKVVPPMDYQIFLEWFHRLIAGMVSVALLGISSYIFLIPALRRRVGKYCVVALLLLAVQVVLGGLTVLGLLNPKWVSSHLAVGLAFLGTNLLLTLELQDYNHPREPKAKRPKLLWLSALAVGALYAQILLGGLVSSNYAGLACPDFPLCNGRWIPAFEGLVRFQFMHRIGAVVATLAVVALVFVAIRTQVSTRARFALLALPGLLVLQIFLGIGSVLFQLPLLMSVAHLGTAAALFGMLLVTNYEIRR